MKGEVALATSKDVIAMAKESGAEIIDLRFTDLPGTVQHLSIPVHELTQSKFDDGQGFDGSSGTRVSRSASSRSGSS